MHKYPEKWSKLNTILSHDWLTGMRGGERVLEILCDGFRDAPIYTLFYNRSVISENINSHPVHTSWLQSVPGIFKYYRNLLPLFPSTIERITPGEADLIISTSHCIAKGIKPVGKTKHICYCFTPMRYAWTFFDEYFGSTPLKALAARPILSSMRRWDKNSSNRVDRFVAISQHVQKRIKEFYGRESDVVYPPVNTQLWTPGNGESGSFDLIVSALVPYKRIDLAVNAYNSLGFPLKIVGIGGELNKLRSMAKGNIEFLQWQSDKNILELYRGCRMLIFPGEEDFGIVPLEAQACGRPVVAYAKGGALETVLNRVSGVFFPEQTVKSLLEAVEECTASAWDKSVIRAHAEKFDNQNFINGMDGVISKVFS